MPTRTTAARLTRMTMARSMGIRTSISTILVSEDLRVIGLGLTLCNVGKYSERDLPDYSLRNFEERGFTVGIGGYAHHRLDCIFMLTHLRLQTCRIWKDCAHACTLPEAPQGVQHRYAFLLILPVRHPDSRTAIRPATVTNDIFTREDQEFLIKNKALPASRILAIETGGCPHAAIREDISANMGALETLQAKFGCQLLFVESGGDNLAANYSRELADYIIYVIDVSVCVAPAFYARCTGC